MIEHSALNPTDTMNAVAAFRAKIAEKLCDVSFTYNIVCRNAAGEHKWTEEVHNVVCTAGINDLLDKYFAGTGYTATWFLLLAGAGTKAAADTLASHAAWPEVTPYTGNRPTITWTAASAGVKAIVANVVSITLAGPTVVAGAGLASVNTGTAGILFSVTDFSVSRSVISGDTLTVSATVGV